MSDLETNVIIKRAGLFDFLRQNGMSEEDANRKIDAITEESDSTKFPPLVTAVQDLLSELDITTVGLVCMSQGFSPSYPGKTEVDLGMATAKVTKNDQNNKVQLSSVVARKLICAGVIGNV